MHCWAGPKQSRGQEDTEETEIPVLREVQRNGAGDRVWLAVLVRRGVQPLLEVRELLLLLWIGPQERNGDGNGKRERDRHEGRISQRERRVGMLQDVDLNRRRGDDQNQAPESTHQQ